MTKLANIEDADTVVTKVEAGDGVIKVTTKTKGVPSEENIEAGKVKSVNGMTGDVVVDLPVGFMYFSLEKTVPAGRLPAMGATYNRELYADLWAYAQERGLVVSESEWQAQASTNDGNCAFYSDGDGTTTFRVPSMKCWVKGADGEEVGSYLEAGLPNITGDTWLRPSSQQMSENGCFYLTTSSNRTPSVGEYAANASNPQRTVGFDASRSNPIHGNSDTVQPKSLVGQWLIVAFGTASNVGNADVANVMQAVEQVQTGLGNVEAKLPSDMTDYIIESYRNGTEWYEVYKSGKVRQGGTLTIANNDAHRITFLKPFANANYQKNVTHSSNSGNAVTYARFGYDKTSTSMIIYGAGTLVDWVTEGQGA